MGGGWKKSGKDIANKTGAGALCLYYSFKFVFFLSVQFLPPNSLQLQHHTAR